tara:strand:- start:470 stop:775 length:306 start_codon:yes stop_codon:yes gene_type:complete
MLKQKEKNAITRGLFLILGWGLGLDRFYEGNKKGGILSILGWNIIFFSFAYIKCSGYVNDIKDYDNYSTNPLIIAPIIAGLYGIFLIIRKAFKIARQFEKG